MSILTIPSDCLHLVRRFLSSHDDMQLRMTCRQLRDEISLHLLVQESLADFSKYGGRLSEQKVSEIRTEIGNRSIQLDSLSLKVCTPSMLWTIYKISPTLKRLDLFAKFPLPPAEPEAVSDSILVLSNMIFLEVLDLTNHMLTDQNWRDLEQLVKLKTLSISGCTLTERTLYCLLAALKNLQSLDLSSCNKKNSDPSEEFSFAGALDHLKVLNLSNQSDFAPLLSPYLYQYPQLRSLNLNRAFSPFVSNLIIESLSKFSPQLIELQLEGCHLNETSLTRLLPALERVTSLDLSCTEISLSLIGRNLRQIQIIKLQNWERIDHDIGYLGSITTIDLIGSGLTSEAFALLGAFSQLKSLSFGWGSREILTNGTEITITDGSWRHLSRLKRLKYLSIENLQIHNSALICLALKTMTDLTSLSLNHCPHLSRLCLIQVSPLTKLQTFRCSFQLSEIDFHHLGILHELRHLEINASSISEDGLDTIINSLPKLETLLLKNEPRNFSATQAMTRARARLGRGLQLRGDDFDIRRTLIPSSFARNGI